MMHEEPRQALRELVRTHGAGLGEDPRRLEALLRDHCGAYRPEIVALIGAVREGIPRELADPHLSVPLEVRMVPLARRLENNLALRPNVAQWATQSWAIALGLANPGGATPAPGSPARDAVVDYSESVVRGPRGVAPAAELASRSSRLSAALIDHFVLSAPFALLLSRDLVGVGLLLLLAVIGVQAYLLTVDGQTIGKRITGLRVVRVSSGGNGGFATNVLMRWFLTGVLNITGIYALFDTLFIFREDRRCLHDLIAGTHVVVVGRL